MVVQKQQGGDQKLVGNAQSSWPALDLMMDQKHKVAAIVIYPGLDDGPETW